MKLTYIAPTAEIILLEKNDVLTASDDWIPGENETERSYSNRSYESYPNF
jgi:hypothetical protein